MWRFTATRLRAICKTWTQFNLGSFEWLPICNILILVGNYFFSLILINSRLIPRSLKSIRSNLSYIIGVLETWLFDKSQSSVIAPLVLKIKVDEQNSMIVSSKSIGSLVEKTMLIEIISWSSERILLGWYRTWFIDWI